MPSRYDHYRVDKIPRIFLLILVMVAITSCSKKNPGEVELPAPAAKFTSEELTKLLKEDKTGEIAKQYAGKVLEITGELVNSVTIPGPNQDARIVMYGGSDGKEFDIVNTMNFRGHSKDIDKIKNLVESDVITVRGEMNSLPDVGPYSNFSLLNSVLVKIESPPADPKPVISTTAEEFVREAMLDRKAFEAKYKRKTVELTATISQSSPSSSPKGCALNAGYAKVPANQTPSLNYSVICEVVTPQLDNVWRMGTQQKVKVVGVLASAPRTRSFVKLVNCEVTALEPNPIITYQANDIVNDFVKDEKMATQKYGEMYKMGSIIIEGEAKEIKRDNNGYRVSLKVTGTTELWANIHNGQKFGDNFPVKVGEPIYLKTKNRAKPANANTIMFDADILSKPESK